MIEKEINLRFLTEGPKTVEVVVQEDELRRLACNLVDIEIPLDATVQAYMYKPSGLVATCYGTVISTTEVQVDLTAQMIAENGTSRFQVKILEDGEAITSYEIPFVVRRDLALESVESEADLTVLETLLSALIAEKLANAYDSTESYAVGDLVSYDGDLYQCTTATTGTWDASDWAEITAVEALDIFIAQAQEAVSQAQEAVNQAEAIATACAITETASGDIASFTDGADGVPVRSLVASIEPVQSGSGDPSPTNVRPISGWDAVTVTRAGINVWDEEWEAGTINGGADATSSVTMRSKNYIPVLEGETYYFQGPNNKQKFIFCYDADKAYINRNISVSAPSTFTIPTGCYYIRIVYTYYIQDYTTYNHDISINYPSTDTSYHASDVDTYTVSLPSTTYGGTLNVTTGVLTVTKAYIASYAGETINEPWISSMDVYASGTTPTTGAQVVYTLATPTTTTLTPTEVTTLLGANNIYADSGEVEVTCVADLKTYIDNATS